MMLFLTADRRGQNKMTRLVLKSEGRDPAGAEQLAQAIDDDMRAKNNGRNWRPKL